MSSAPLPPPDPIVPQLGPDGLPVAVQAALWCTELLHGRLEAAELVDHAFAAADAVTPSASQQVPRVVAAWRDTGERLVLAALPRPGRPGTFPVGAQGLGAAMDLQAVGVLLAPSLGEGLVLRMTPFGHALDGGWLLDAEPVDCPPVPARRLEALDLRTAQRAFTAGVARGVDLLEGLAASPVWTGHRSGGPAVSTAGDLPSGVDASVLDLLERASAVAAMTTQGRDTHAAHARVTARRHEALAALHRVALDTLEAGSLAAAGALAGKPSSPRR